MSQEDICSEFFSSNLGYLLIYTTDRNQFPEGTYSVDITATMTLNGATMSIRRNIEFKDPCKNSFLEIDAIEDSIQLIINATEPTYYRASWQH